jgi:hypothetical protein
MIEQTLTAHARPEAQEMCGAENFFATLIYFELEEYCGSLPVPSSGAVAVAGW